MKKLSGWAIFGIILGIFAVFGSMYVIGNYNNLISLRENVNNQYSNIDVCLQRRSDLIPNLVSTVKGYTNHEKEILTQISESRAKLSGAGNINEKSQASTELTNALSRLLVVVENYPNLKADAQFIALTDELAGTENRIAVARRDYNTAVQTYNQTIKKFPTNIIANMFNFESAERFESTDSAREVPIVNFE
ncbi:MAG: LemA family protein [Clostridia bacterium]|nr:LemA family protein [Clostridia bacterium]